MEYRLRAKIQDMPGDGEVHTLATETPTLIGRREPADIVLALPEVSGRHASMKYEEAQGLFVLQDLNSTQGTFVNAKPVPPGEDTPLNFGDVVQIGRAFLLLERSVDGAAGDDDHGDVIDTALGLDVTGLAAGDDDVLATMIGGAEITVDEADAEEEPASFTARDGRGEGNRSLTQEVQAILLQRVDLAKVVRQASDDEHARDIVRQQIVYVVNELWRKGRISEAEIPKLEKDAYDDILGFGPIQDLMDDPSVSEVMVNESSQIYFEKDGKISLCQRWFQSDEHVQQVLRRLLRESQRRIDEANPVVNATVYGGCRLNAILPPIALRGTTITIRKFHHNLGVDELVGFGSMSRAIADFLQLAVSERQNIIVSGGTGSGKTTLLNVLSAFIPEDQRIVTVEDTAELSLVQPHVVRLQARPANTEGTGLISIRDLVVESLRMRPDRIIVGECRSGEALDMLQAMNTGHDGSLTTVHSNSAADAFYRLETMVLLTGLDLPIRAIREQIRSAVNLIVHQARMLDGTRKVTEVIEMTALEGDEIVTQPVFGFVQEGIGEDGKIIGTHKPTGYIPTFLNTMRQQGKEIPAGLFDM